MKLPDMYAIQTYLADVDLVGVPQLMNKFSLNFADGIYLMRQIIDSNLVGERVDGFSHKVCHEQLTLRIIKRGEVRNIILEVNEEMAGIMVAIEDGRASTYDQLSTLISDEKALMAALDKLEELKILCRLNGEYRTRVERGVGRCFVLLNNIKRRARVLERDVEGDTVMENLTGTFLKHVKVE